MQNRPYQGIIPPIITPLLAPDVLDEAGLEKLIEHLVTGGVHGLFILGTTGEGPALSYELRRQLIRETCKRVAGRIPVLVGILDTSYGEAVNLGRYAGEQGADAVVSAAPYYLPLSQRDKTQFMKQLAQDVPLPVLLYNPPSLPSSRLSIETLQALAESPGICGLKDSSGDQMYLETVIREMRGHENFLVLVGPENLLLSSLLLGAHGGISAGANLFPRLYVDFYEACLQRDTPKLERLAEGVQEVWRRIFTVGDRETSITRGLKCALSLLGICQPPMTFPFQPANEQEIREVSQYLREAALKYTGTTVS